MARITTPTDDQKKPQIERADVLKFFERRAQRIDELGPVKAVIYQDKHPTLAQERDHAEKSVLMPLIAPLPTDRVLDIGCGTGRWTKALSERCSHYHGFDFSSGLIDYACQAHGTGEHLRFSVSSAEDFSLDSLGEREPFHLILCCGVLIYLNDDEVANVGRCIADVAASGSKVVLREPVAINERLTIKAHYSEDLEHDYNAIYRTTNELWSLLATHLIPAGFRLVLQAPVYEAPELNNRKDTVQYYFVVERG